MKKMVGLFAILFLFPFVALSQVQYYKKIFGTVDVQQIFGIAIAEDGGYVLSGSTDGKMNLTKFDPTGNLEWSNVLLPTLNFGAEGKTCVSVSDGGFLICGWGKPDFSSMFRSQLVKVDDLGEFQWAMQYGSPSYAVKAWSVDASDLGGFYLAGWTEEFSTRTAFVIKTDDSGTMLWSRSFGSSGDTTEFKGLVATADGGCLAVGYTNAYLSESIDVFVVKLDGFGGVSWAKTYKASFDDEEDYAWGVRQMDNGDYAVVGNTGSFSYTRFRGDALVMLLDSLGNFKWAKTLGDADEAESLQAARSVVQTSDGNLVVCGYASVGMSEEGFVAKFDADIGEPVWGRLYPFGNGREHFRYVVEEPSGDLVVAGYVRSLGAGEDDAFLMRATNKGQGGGCYETSIPSNFEFNDHVFVVTDVFPPESSMTITQIGLNDAEVTTVFEEAFLCSGTYHGTPEWHLEPICLDTLFSLTNNVRQWPYSNIAVASSDKRIILFEKNNSPESGIYLTYSFDGLTWEAPRKFLDSIQSTLDILFPKLIGDAFGRLHFIWHSNMLGALFYTQLDENFTVVIDSVRITDNSSYGIYVGSHITVDGQGRIHAMWHEGDNVNLGETSEAFYAYSLDGGCTFSEPVAISEEDGKNSAWPWAEFDAYDGDTLIIAWRDQVAGSNWDIKYNISYDGGVSWEGVQTMAPHPGYQADPDVVIAPNGDFHIFTHETHEVATFPASLRILHRVSSDYGNSWSDPDTLSNDMRSLVTECSRYKNGVLWTFFREIGNDMANISGDLVAVYSVDNGQTWSVPEYFSDEGAVIVGQKGIAFLADGRPVANYEVPFTSGITLKYRERLTAPKTSPLFVDLIKFEASVIIPLSEKPYIRLDWETAQEINNKGFEIERSTDGLSWEVLGFVKGRGNSATPTSYVFEDEDVREGIRYYYRLYQIDYNGEAEYSNVVFEEIPVGDFIVGALYPNPASTKVFLSLIGNWEQAKLMVIDAVGRQVYESVIEQANGQVIGIDLSLYPSGIYHLFVFSDGKWFAQRFVVE